jgi:predicted acyl esterase
MLSIVPPGFLHARGQLYGYPKVEAPKKLLVVQSPGFFAHVLFKLSKPLNAYMLKWFDHWLKGVDNGIMNEPPVTIYDSGTHEWRYEKEYPLARTKWTKFYLRSNNAGSAGKPPFGLISGDAPTGNEEPDSYMTPDLKQILARKPVLAYSTAPLQEDLRVWGPLSTLLYGSTTTRDTVWFLKLGDQGPDGKIKFLSRGVLKASLRDVDRAKSKPGQPFHPYQKPILPEPNKIYDFQIEMRPIFHTFKAGHKIWIQIQSDDPEYQTLLHTLYSSELLPVPGKNTIYHDAEHPSHLLLPVIPDAPIIKAVGPPVSEIKWPLK